MRAIGTAKRKRSRERKRQRRRGGRRIIEWTREIYCVLRAKRGAFRGTRGKDRPFLKKDSSPLLSSPPLGTKAPCIAVAWHAEPTDRKSLTASAVATTTVVPCAPSRELEIHVLSRVAIRNETRGKRSPPSSLSQRVAVPLSRVSVGLPAVPGSWSEVGLRRHLRRLRVAGYTRYYFSSLLEMLPRCHFSLSVVLVSGIGDFPNEPGAGEPDMMRSE